MKRFLALFLTAFLLSGCTRTPIGTIRGAELEEIVIDGITYEADPGDEHQSFTAADKGKYLGTVTNADEVFRVYAVKGDSDHQYLYVLWDWEGTFYVRME